MDPCTSSMPVCGRSLRRKSPTTCAKRPRGPEPGDRVEHLAVHPQSAEHFTLGFYLLSDSLEEAELRAEAVCRRMLGARVLPRARLLDVGVPLMPLSLLEQRTG